MKLRWFVGSALLWIVAVHPVFAQSSYERPPKAILDVLDAPALPVSFVSPAGNALLLATPLRYPPISDLAEPLLRLAGVRINPRNNGVHGSGYYVGYSLKKLPDGAEVAVQLPAGARLSGPRWNASGSMFAFWNMTDSNVELWILDVAKAKATRIDGVSLNPVLGSTWFWMPDGKTLLIKAVPANRTAAPKEIPAPVGPHIEESGAVRAASSTYEARDLLKTPYDADLFEHYATAQLALVDTQTRKVTNAGPAGVLAKVQPSPNGQAILVERVLRPYSFTRPYSRFPTDVEVWDLNGSVVEKLASLPLAEQVPIHGVRTGPREYAWRPTAPATLTWVEALDDGDTYKKVPHHDRVMMKGIGGEPVELLQTENRFTGLDWIERGGLALAGDYDEDKHWYKVYLVEPDNRSAAPRLVWSRSSDDRYDNPGNPVYRMLPNGAFAVREHEGTIFLSGQGASPAGNRPFLDRLNLKTLKSERWFRSPTGAFESFLGALDPASKSFLTRRESRTDPPNVYWRTVGGRESNAAAGEPAYRSTSRQLTHVVDPAPQLRQISKRLVTYERPDGVKLSFTLYLPPGYKEGTRLPTAVWAYPLDYTDPGAAGQVSASPQEFTQIYGASPVFLALLGYAVLDQTAMPVVGATETAYDTFIDQIVANAKAAIDKSVELGVTDRDRVGVFGHSHGALMTANLLAWSDLFRAGVARSGAYNHTLRPFGFQNERRTLYKATDTYLKLSPLLHASQIDEPLLIIHGERDANPGTVPLQSEKLFEAVRGVGGKTRLVMLPLESHGYAARQSVEHTLYETVTWFDKYVKNASPRTTVVAK
ncbi:MAG TPA: prolyl oligopeptidase family serine peptidase [Thermoanaerobaculia bacterium]|nr:prolyl oligopeptidase family serine peptidase [Thermoanaerobaculia bacterium]